MRLRRLSKSHYQRDGAVLRDLKRSEHDRDGPLHDALLTESQKRQIRMKAAINIRHTGAAFGLKSVVLKPHSQLKVQRLLSKRKRSCAAEYRLGELRSHKPNSSPE